MPDLSRKNSLVARMAGNIAAGLVQHDGGRYRGWDSGSTYVRKDNVAQDAVAIALAIVGRLEEAEAHE